MIIQWIKDYLDKQLDKRFQQHKQKIDEQHQQINRRIRHEVPDQINRTIKNIIFYSKDFDGNNNAQMPDEVHRVVNEVGYIIRKRFKDELERLQKRRESVEMMERKLKKDLKEITRDEINSEQFIDELVKRIKRKQL